MRVFGLSAVLGSILSGASHAAFLNSSPRLMGHRTAAGTKRGRQMVSRRVKASRYHQPHIGAKEQARAARSYMQSTHGAWSDNQRSAPTMCQAAK